MRNIIGGGVVTLKPIGGIVTNNPTLTQEMINLQKARAAEASKQATENDNYLRAKPCQPNPR